MNPTHLRAILETKKENRERPKPLIFNVTSSRTDQKSVHEVKQSKESHTVEYKRLSLKYSGTVNEER